jgi:hypothetical protein
MVYSGDYRAPSDEGQVSLKHMLYHRVEKVYAPLQAVFLNFECLSCILIAWYSLFDSKAIMRTYDVPIL